METAKRWARWCAMFVFASINIALIWVLAWIIETPMGLSIPGLPRTLIVSPLTAAWIMALTITGAYGLAMAWWKLIIVPFWMLIEDSIFPAKTQERSE